MIYNFAAAVSKHHDNNKKRPCSSRLQRRGYAVPLCLDRRMSAAAAARQGRSLLSSLTRINGYAYPALTQLGGAAHGRISVSGGNGQLAAGESLAGYPLWKTRPLRTFPIDAFIKINIALKLNQVYNISRFVTTAFEAGPRLGIVRAAPASGSSRGHAFVRSKRLAPA